MKTDDTNEKDMYNGEQIAIIQWIPKDAFKIKCEVDFLNNGEVTKAYMEMTPEMIRNARNDYLLLDPDDDAFVTYKLTEKGRRYAEELEKLQNIN